MRQNREKDQNGDPVEGLEGTIERFTYRDAESGFAVVRFAVEGDPQPVALVGQLAQLAEGQRVTVSGTRMMHPRFGPQIEVDAAEAITPSSVEGIRAYLSSSLVKGIGPAMAERITDAFGTESLRIIEEEPERLATVRGLGPKKADELVHAVRSQRDIQDVMVFLRTHGLGQNLAVRIVKQLGSGASAAIQANPYRLADTVIGVGFRRADELAASLGIRGDAPERVRAGIEFTLGRAGRDGHCFLPDDDLSQRCAELLACSNDAVSKELPWLAKRGRIVLDRVAPLHPDVAESRYAVYPSALHSAEVAVAERLHTLATEDHSTLPIDAEPALAWFVERSGMALPTGQHEALLAALREPVSVITGGPGVGKTTIIRALVDILGAKNLRVSLAAPTGRAAKRLEESTDHGASTLHRLLDFQPGRNEFTRNADRPIEADMIVVDEASMIDVQLGEHLLRAVAAPTKLVLVGDVDQLPSVGPGSVLADIIRSEHVAVTRLTEIFRQHGDSDIVRSAHRILEGQGPVGGGDGSDFYFVEARDAGHARKLICEIVTQRIPNAFDFDPMREVQVLCPMYRGDTGADALNADLQDLLNPVRTQGDGAGRNHGLRPGDKVLQTRNDYDLDVFNGDTGRVRSIDRASGRVSVDFGERIVEYESGALDQLVPSYAISVHRSQGSEYPAVVIPVTNDHYLMLRRNLLYTAITRGKRLVIVVGTPQALDTAIGNTGETVRNTMLADRLRRLGVEREHA